MNVHPCHIRFAVTLDHAQEFLAVPLIKAGVISHQIGRRNVFGAQILDYHVEQLSSYTLTAMAFLRVHGTDIGGTSTPGGFQ